MYRFSPLMVGGTFFCCIRLALTWTGLDGMDRQDDSHDTNRFLNCIVMNDKNAFSPFGGPGISAATLSTPRHACNAFMSRLASCIDRSR